jgi:hypothetical protein
VGVRREGEDGTLGQAQQLVEEGMVRQADDEVLQRGWG